MSLEDIFLHLTTTDTEAMEPPRTEEPKEVTA